MSIDIAAEVKFAATTDKGVYFVLLRDSREGTNIGTVFQDDSGWKSYNHDKKFTGHGGTRYMAARGLLEDYELANGLRDSEGRRVGRDPEVLGFWCVLGFQGTRQSERWTDKADAIAHLASLQPIAEGESPEITPVLVWSDGTVTGGIKELTDRLTGQAYGHDTDEFALYVTQGGALYLASTRQLSQTADGDDWIREEYGVYVGDAVAPVLTISLRIDGRA